LHIVKTPPEHFDFDEYLATRRNLLEEKLKEYLSEEEPAVLWEAMRYSVLSGGKRLRAILTFAAAEAVWLHSDLSKHNDLDATELVMPLAGAIEMIHAMSLIHDDLPCLDNDDLRRGRPTNHKVYGEAMALLAGDGLLVLASDILIQKSASIIDRQNLLDVAMHMARATGPSGMVGGQVMDMQFTGHDAKALDVATIQSIHAGKTGALIRFALWAPSRLFGVSKELQESLWRLGEIIGLAFQIRDDLLDVTADAETLGKTPGKDAASNKATWVTAIGSAGAKGKLQDLAVEGHHILDESAINKGDAAVLHHLLTYAITRKS
jgi:geranylgeranyl diphosphate synthase type II